MTTLTHVSKHPDRIRAAVRALEAWDRARFLCVEPIHKFDYRSWHCGTTACAGGFLAVHPAFRARGLVTNDLLLSPRFHREDGINALALFFDVSCRIATYWFILAGKDCGKPRGDVPPQDVANAMRAYLREIGEEHAPAGTVAARTMP